MASITRSTKLLNPITQLTTPEFTFDGISSSSADGQFNGSFFHWPTSNATRSTSHGGTMVPVGWVPSSNWFGPIVTPNKTSIEVHLSSAHFRIRVLYDLHHHLSPLRPQPLVLWRSRHTLCQRSLPKQPRKTGFQSMRLASSAKLPTVTWIYQLGNKMSKTTSHHIIWFPNISLYLWQRPAHLVSKAGAVGAGRLFVPMRPHSSDPLYYFWSVTSISYHHHMERLENVRIFKHHLVWLMWTNNNSWRMLFIPM